MFRETLQWLCSILHCWKILLILVLGKVASKTQYSHFVICKVWVLGFTHHFTLHPLIWQIFSLISWLYFSTMWILWGRKCDYWVFNITHAKKGHITKNFPPLAFGLYFIIITNKTPWKLSHYEPHYQDGNSKYHGA